MTDHNELGITEPARDELRAASAKLMLVPLQQRVDAIAALLDTHIDRHHAELADHLRLRTDVEHWNTAQPVPLDHTGVTLAVAALMEVTDD